MKRGRFTEDQIIGIPKEHEAGVFVADLCRKHGVSDATVQKRKVKYRGMDISEAKRLRRLKVTCHWTFIQPRPEPGGHFRLFARVVKSPGAELSSRAAGRVIEVVRCSAKPAGIW
jgi:hypothetical protein